MRFSTGEKAVFRFAPSPNGGLHLGHALSALLNHDLARLSGGRFLLRMEDIDQVRCKPEFEDAIYRDLEWLGLSWEQPVRRQSEHFDAYQEALDGLKSRGLVYPAFMTRGEIKAHVDDAESHNVHWPRDPDGSPHYPPFDRDRNDDDRNERIRRGDKHTWRLNMNRALAELKQPLTFKSFDDDRIEIHPADPAKWGDVVLSRSDAPSSYHLSVTIDDSLQSVSHVVRGQDLLHATDIHRLLQVLLGLPEPVYHHHRLILGDDGRKLSKSLKDQSLTELRQKGFLRQDIRRLVGL